MNYKEILSELNVRGIRFLTATQILDNEIVSDKPNVVIRHDVESPSGDDMQCLWSAFRMMQAEEQENAISTFYLLPTYKSSVLMDFKTYESLGWEIGMHVCSNDPKVVIEHLRSLRKQYNIRTAVPHQGSYIADDILEKEGIRYLANINFRVQNDGYIADNGNRIAKLTGFDDKNNPLWVYGIDIIKHIRDMENGKVYHFLFHPCWYDENLDFTGVISIANSVRKHNTLWACMIVRDEEKYLEDALISIKPYVDEIVIVDTGSVDKTIEIAKKYTDKIYSIEWEGNYFAGSRNESIRHAENADWVFIIDADERLDSKSGERMRRIIDESQYDSIIFQVHSPLPTGSSMNFGPRLFKREVAGYSAIVHNQPIYEGTSLVTDLSLTHIGYNLPKEEMLVKWKRTEMLLKKQIEGEPDTPFHYMNLVRIYRCLQQWQDVIKTVDDITSRLDVATLNDAAYCGLMVDYIYSHYELRLLDKAFDIGKTFLEKFPEVLDAVQFMGGISLELGKLDDAIKYFNQHIELTQQYGTSKKFTRLTMDTLGASGKSWNNLGKCYMDKSQFQKAIDCYHKAINCDGSIPLYVENLKFAKTKTDKQSLNILFVQDLTCIRNYKLANALKKAGHKVTLAYGKAKLSDIYKKDDSIYEQIIKIQSLQQLVELAEQFDVIHCHNEPDEFTCMLNGVGIVIHDTHDLMSLRCKNTNDYGQRLATEFTANRNSSGQIYTTEQQKDYAIVNHGAKKTLVIPNYVSEDNIPQEFKSKLSASDNEIHIVYEGGIGTNHRDFKKLFSELPRFGIHLHVYPTFINPEYTGLNIINLHIHDPISPEYLISEMTQYDYGLIPFNITEQNQEFLDTCVGNKIYEYMAAGLPVISCDTKGLRKVIEDNKCGIIFKNADDIVAQLGELENITIGKEHVFTIESQIPKLVDFYHELIENRVSINKEDIGKQWIDQLNFYEYQRQAFTGINTRPIEYAYVFNKLNEHKPIEVMDIGSGQTALPALMRHSGFIVHAIDNIKDYWIQGMFNRHYAILNNDIMNPEVKGHADLITCVSVLEHISDPDKAVKNMIRLLSMNGHLVITFPYCETQYVENVYKMDGAGYGQNYNYPCHVFSKAQIDKWCQDNGAELVDMEYWQVFDGKLWTFGKKLDNVVKADKDSLHHLACLTIRKTSVMMTKEELIKEEQGHPDKSYQVYKGELAWDEPTRANIQKRINRIIELSSGDVLDIGCSDGIVSILLAEKGLNVVGLDMEQGHIDNAKANLEKASPKAQRKAFFRQGWAEELPQLSESFDIIVLGEILEHVLNADIVLAEACRVLKPDGQLLASVPLGTNLTPQHKQFFDVDIFKALLNKYFESIEIEIFGTQILGICKKKVT